MQAECVGLSLASVKINVISSGGRSQIDLMLEVPLAAANDSGESSRVCGPIGQLTVVNRNKLSDSMRLKVAQQRVALDSQTKPNSVASGRAARP